MTGTFLQSFEIVYGGERMKSSDIKLPRIDHMQ